MFALRASFRRSHAVRRQETASQPAPNLRSNMHRRRLKKRGGAGLKRGLLGNRAIGQSFDGTMSAAQGEAFAKCGCSFLVPSSPVEEASVIGRREAPVLRCHNWGVMACFIEVRVREQTGTLACQPVLAELRRLCGCAAWKVG